MNIRKNTLSPQTVFKNTSLLVWTGVVLVLGAGLVMMHSVIEKSVAEVMSSNQNIALVQETLNAFSDLKMQGQKAEAYQQKLKELFPAKEGLLRVLAYLEDRAGFYHLQQFFTFGAEAETTAQEPAHIGFNLSLTGGLPEFVQYLKEIEQSRSLISFSNIEVAGKTKNTFQINTAGKIYIQSYATSTK